MVVVYVIPGGYDVGIVRPGVKKVKAVVLAMIEGTWVRCLADQPQARHQSR